MHLALILLVKDASLYESWLCLTTSYKKDASNIIKFHLVLQMLQMAEYHARTVVSVTSLKRPSMKVRKQKLLNFLQGMLTSKHVVLQPGNPVHSSAFWSHC